MDYPQPETRIFLNSGPALCVVSIEPKSTFPLESSTASATPVRTHSPEMGSIEKHRRP